MNRFYQSSQLAEWLVKAGLIAALACVLLLPTTIRTEGAETRAQAAQAFDEGKRANWQELRLPPIKHLDTMPWLVREPARETMRIDMLLPPRFDHNGFASAGKGSDEAQALRMPQWQPPRNDG
jgi:hypothetical protein